MLYLDAEQSSMMTSNSINNTTYQGVEYAMDVKFKSQICNCAPSEIEGCGRYAWTKGSYDKLIHIPRLPDELFDMIREPTKKQTPAPTRTTPATTAPAIPAKTQIHDFRALFSCLSTAQLDSYDTWIKIGMILNSVGSPLSLWEEVSKRSKKYQAGECAKK
jgi:hypothetical protein